MGETTSAIERLVLILAGHTRILKKSFPSAILQSQISALVFQARWAREFSSSIRDMSTSTFDTVRPPQPIHPGRCALSSGSASLFDYVAAFHHELHPPQLADVFHGVAIYGNDVRVFEWLNGTDSRLQPEQFRAIDRCCTNDL